MFVTRENIVPRKVSIITKPDSDESQSFSEQIIQWFNDRDIDVLLNDIIPQLDLVIVLGGDGTLLHIAEQAAKSSIPILGINLGSLGFLTELNKADTFNTLEQIINSEVNIENRMMIKSRVVSEQSTTDYRFALNEVVISKNALDRILNLSTRVDGALLTEYRADGLIFSTPTGSTAYNLSAGGPLVYPGLSTILVTPICPFMLSSRPVILPADNIVSTKFRARASDETAQVIVDGQRLWKMQNEDRLEIEPAGQPLKLIVADNHNYFSILRKKLHWGVDRRNNF